ncbi:hypothetical protein [Ekhidna sp. To15]|uniref:hypothetical protein n=1 Tax=Ekhidna sp. To15 TaxID=3395267 RepID=UPI003F5212FF
MRLLFTTILTALVYTFTFGQIRTADKVRIKEAKRISNQFGDSIWKDFSEAPFAILLVMDDYEYLIEHSSPPGDFEEIGYDTLIGSKTYRRPTQMNKGFLATFPFAGISTIVIGTPENTGLNSTEWMITLLHEHFHQYQYSSPGYFKDINALDLANGDETGMWQLNYPFPYNDVSVIEKYEAYAQALYDAVNAIGKTSWNEAKKKFFKTRKAFKAVLSEDDYKYLSFQWYQEGIARYTEYAFLEMLKEFEVAQEIEQLEDFVSFEEYKKSFFEKHMKSVLNLKLEEVGRVTVYDVGFAEALILREFNPGWEDKYLDIKFDLEKLY